MEKICSKCKISKPISDFRKRAGSLYGVRADCTACCKIQQKEHYINNREKIIKKVSTYNEKNKEAHQKNNCIYKKKEAGKR